MDRTAFAQAVSELGITLSDEQLDAFEEFEEKLYEANKVMNLTRVPREEAWQRHFLDSLLFSSLIPEGSAVLDIGTGPGFPAWPLARARPDLAVTALDSSGKMLGFLRSMPLDNLEVVQARAEESGLVDSFDVVTGRALAPLTIQLEVSASPCKLGGIVLPMRTEQDLREIERLGKNPVGLVLEGIERRVLDDATRVYPIFRKASKTPPQYPRSWAEIKRKPL